MEFLFDFIWYQWFMIHSLMLIIFFMYLKKYRIQDRYLPTLICFSINEKYCFLLIICMICHQSNIKIKIDKVWKRLRDFFRQMKLRQCCLLVLHRRCIWCFGNICAYILLVLLYTCIRLFVVIFLGSFQENCLVPKEIWSWQSTNFASIKIQNI